MQTGHVKIFTYLLSQVVNSEHSCISYDTFNKLNLTKLRRDQVPYIGEANGGSLGAVYLANTSVQKAVKTSYLNSLYVNISTMKSSLVMTFSYQIKWESLIGTLMTCATELSY